jgi:hypothetical protein
LVELPLPIGTACRSLLKRIALLILRICGERCRLRKDSRKSGSTQTSATTIADWSLFKANGAVNSRSWDRFLNGLGSFMAGCSTVLVSSLGREGESIERAGGCAEMPLG